MSGPERMTWALVVGEYPPQPGGVADYTVALARALAADGDAVHVFAPPCAEPDIHELGIVVHRLPDVYRARGRRMVDATLATLPHPRAAVVQYVAQSFGMRGCNVPFAAWLRRFAGYPLFVMFHEVAVTVTPATPLKYRVQAFATRIMARFAARAADAIFITTPAWKDRIGAITRPRASIAWTPVPSNIALCNDPATKPHIRARFGVLDEGVVIGHFGTYREQFSRDAMDALAPHLAETARALVFMGRGSERFAAAIASRYPHLRGRVYGTGGLGPQALANHLASCDVLVQPFADGVTARRSSVTGALALGVPVVTTSGPTTEELWRTSAAVGLAPADDRDALIAIVRRVATDDRERRRLRERSRALYDERFAIGHTVAALRRAAGEEET